MVKKEDRDESQQKLRVVTKSITFLKRMDKYYFGLYGEEVPKYVKNQKKPKRRKRNRGTKGRKCNATGEA